MIQRKATIINKMGLHARPSAMLVSTAAKFISEIFFSRDDLRVNGKSIMGVMMLAAEKGVELVVEADGPDEKEAIESLVEVISSGFGEYN